MSVQEVLVINLVRLNLEAARKLPPDEAGRALDGLEDVLKKAVRQEEDMMRLDEMVGVFKNN